MLPIGQLMRARTAIIEPVEMRTDHGNALAPADEMPASAKPDVGGAGSALARMASDIQAQRKEIIKHRDEMVRRLGRVVCFFDVELDFRR